MESREGVLVPRPTATSVGVLARGGVTVTVTAATDMVDDDCAAGAEAGDATLSATDLWLLLLLLRGGESARDAEGCEEARGVDEEVEQGSATGTVAAAASS
jgi:hypothetical protein